MPTVGDVARGIEYSADYLREQIRALGREFSQLSEVYSGTYGYRYAYQGAGSGDNIVYMTNRNNPYDDLPSTNQRGFEDIISDWPVSRTGTPKHGSQTGSTGKNSTILGKNLEKAGYQRPKTETGESYQAHHIIPSTHPEAYGLRMRMSEQDINIDINSAENGIFLPREVHTAIHKDNKAYVTWLSEELSQATTQDDFIALLGNIADKLKNGEYPPKQ